MSRYPFTAFPDGWFAIAWSSDVAPGAVVMRHYFGQDLVVYRGAAGGAAQVVDPHCPHLGAHLGHGGTVVGETLRCPFHGWCYDAAGACVEVPGATRIPKEARLGVWPTVEHNGLVFVWHHAAGAAPSWTLAPLVEAGWSADRTVLWNLRSHPQEVFENSVDSAHLPALHRVHEASVGRAPAADGHVMNVMLRLRAGGEIVGMEGMVNDVELDVTMHGLGQMEVVTTVLNVPGVRARQRVYPAPIDGERIDLRAVVNVENTPDPAVTEVIGTLFHQAFLVDFVKDFPVWENKRYVEKPPLSSNDGPVHPFRRWCKQFYQTSWGGGATVARVLEG